MTSVVVAQCIESSTYIILALISWLVYRTHTDRKSSVSDDIAVLKDCIYYQRMITKYREHCKRTSGKSYSATFHKVVKEELGYGLSSTTSFSNAEKRLRVLDAWSEELEDFRKLRIQG